MKNIKKDVRAQMEFKAKFQRSAFKEVEGLKGEILQNCKLGWSHLSLMG